MLLSECIDQADKKSIEITLLTRQIYFIPTNAQFSQIAPLIDE